MTGRSLVRAAVVLAAFGCGGRAATDAAAPIDAGLDALVPTCTPRSGSRVRLVPVASLADMPVHVTSPPGDRRVFVVQRDGQIVIIKDDQVRAPAFLDLSDGAGGPVVRFGGESGLLGLAFHPGYARNGRFYVYYAIAGSNVVAEYRVSADPDRADALSGRVILSIADFASNHNGGMIEFWDDGLLYVSTGDGGGSGDPQRTAQDRDSLLGKMLRLDVDRPADGRLYGIPAGNPYAAGGGAPEVLMSGLRNPWRWSFDRATGDIYIGDVGQGAVEEIDVVPLAEAAGADFGWSDCEGTRNFHGNTGCAAPTQPRRVKPVYEQLRPNGGGTSNWEAVIGGQVYRGDCFPDLVGRYFFSEHHVGGIWSFVYANGQATDVIAHPGPFPSGTNALHADALGELYVVFGPGDVMRLEVE